MFKTKREASIDVAATQPVLWTLIVINSETLIQDINFFFANEGVNVQPKTRSEY